MPNDSALSANSKYLSTLSLKLTMIAFSVLTSFFGLAICRGLGRIPNKPREQSERFLFTKTWLAS